MKKALLVNISEIGDVVSSSVVLDEVLSQGYQVTFMVLPFIKPLWDESENLKLISSEDIPEEHFDLLIDLTSKNLSRKIVRQVKAKKKIGRSRNLSQKIRHSISTYTQMVPKFPYKHIVRDYLPIIKILKGNQERIPTLKAANHLPECYTCLTSERIISIHAGANNQKRIIPKHLLVDVIQFAKDQHFKVILIGTEKDLIEEIQKETNHFSFYESLTLKEVKMLLKASELFIGSDSGILHIASALDVNAIGVYGPNKSSESGPLSKKVTFLEQNLDCRPCNQNKFCSINIKCMNTLSSIDLINIVKEKLKLT